MGNFKKVKALDWWAENGPIAFLGMRILSRYAAKISIEYIYIYIYIYMSDALFPQV